MPMMRPQYILKSGSNPKLQNIDFNRIKNETSRTQSMVSPLNIRLPETLPQNPQPETIIMPLIKN